MLYEVITASIAAPGEVDYFAVDVPQLGNVEAEITDRDGACPFDATLALIAPDGATTLVFDNDGGVDLCPHIDPRRDARAAQLTPGRYFLLVTGRAA